MVHRFWLLAGAAGLVSALLYGLAPPNMMGGLLLSVLLSVPLFIAGLGMGALAGAIASAVAAVAVLVLQGSMAGATFAGGVAVPVAILLRQAMLSRTIDGTTEWYPAGMLVATLTIVGLALAVAINAIVSSLPVQEYFDRALRTFAEDFAADNAEFTAEGLLERIAWVRRFIPGMTTGFWMLILLAGGALAQAALVKMKRNLRPWPDLVGMELPNWLAIVAAVIVTAAMFLPDPAGSYALAMAFAACFAFLLQGLAVVHAFNRKIQGGMILLVIFYLLVFGQVWPVILVALLGAVEQLVRLRQRWLATVEE